jgi:hypothetical protein
MLRDVDTILQTAGSTLRKGLTFRAEGQLSPMSGVRRRPWGLLFGCGHGL